MTKARQSEAPLHERYPLCHYLNLNGTIIANVLINLTINAIKSASLSIAAWFQAD